MPTRLGLVAVVVADYDPAIAFYTKVLGFELLEDTPLAAGKRWVVIAPPGGGCAILLARAANPHQASRVGDQTGGRVFLFLHTDDFARDYQAFVERGVVFMDGPREEAYGRVAVFVDCCGNKWDLVEKRG